MSEVKRWVVPMRGRDPNEDHRASTPLELFFDLVIVVAIAVAAAATSLHHGIADEPHPQMSILGYILTFFAIWWAWMGFTWFAAAYDTDDVPYRIAVFVQMAGAIIMAAGIGASLRMAATGRWSCLGLRRHARSHLSSSGCEPPRDDPPQPNSRTSAIAVGISVACRSSGSIAIFARARRNTCCPAIILLRGLGDR